MTPRPIFQFLAREAAAGQRTCLVTVTGVTGASTRNPGAHMGVAESGAYAGSLSGGCIEAAVVAEAQGAIRDGASRTVSFGAGSSYIDIRLPCGGRIDLLFTPLRDTGFAAAVDAALGARESVELTLSTGTNPPIWRVATPTARVITAGNQVAVGHVPPLRIVVMGHGASVDALTGQAAALGAELVVLSPDAAILDRAGACGAEAHQLKTHGASDALVADAWTAVVCLFHDHDWEGPLLAQALGTPAFYVGAMGSRKTHAARLEGLRALGVAEADAARIISPIGLIPSSRDPETLALSILGQVVAAYNALVDAQLGGVMVAG